MSLHALVRAGIACALLSPVAAFAEEVPITPPRLLQPAQAEYPEEARRIGLGGTVVLQLIVGADGAVQSAIVTRSAGHGFDEAALAAVHRLRFEPALQSGAPIPVQIGYEVHFELPQAGAGSDSVTASSLLQATVEGERPFTAASARTVRDRDFLLRPRDTPEDILRVVPGLVLAQHQGGGKADQLFLRGFDADHGTDVSVNLDGVPVNMPSHAHGQGYADLHFLIPEVIERIDITKGPYFAEQGDLATAGAVNLLTRDRLEHSEVSAMSGIFPTLGGNRDDGTPRKFAGYRVLGLLTPGGELRPFFAAEVFGSGGPFLFSQRLERYNLFAKATATIAPHTTVSLSAMAYSSSWIGSGQIPARLVDAGVIDRYGAIDPSEGGDTQRQQAIVTLTSRPDDRSSFTAALSGIRYGLTLFNDFTFQAENAQSGDEIEQDDRRTIVYASLRYDRGDNLFGGRLLTTLGAQFRNDDVDASLWKAHQRVRLASCLSIANPCVNTNDRQSDAAAYVQADLRPFRWLRLVLGLRSDTFQFDVRSQKPDSGIDAGHTDPLVPVVQRSIQSPKASLVVTPVEEVDLYFNFGSGFHSNDARSAIETGGAGALPRAIGYELGARGRLLGGKLDLAGALWRLDLESELVWSGDAGGTEASGATRREGVDLEARCEILPWLFADLDVALAKSRYKADAGNGNAVALAPPRIVTGGLTARHPSGVQGALRLRHIGPRPASQLTADDGVPPCTPGLDAGARCYLVADGYTLLDATLAYAQPRWSLTLTIENLTNAVFREAQFGNESQVVTAPPGAQGAFTPEQHPVQDIHFTPGIPLTLRLATSVRF